jgi:hypothetical protein
MVGTDITDSIRFVNEFPVAGAVSKHGVGGKLIVTACIEVKYKFIG